MDQIFIEQLVINCVIGVYEWERQKPRRILVNLALFTDLHKAGQSDDIADSIDYGIVARKVQNLAEISERRTLEALATDIAQLCLQIPGVEKVRVRVEKPGAVQHSRSVGVEIEREGENRSLTESN